MVKLQVGVSTFFCETAEEAVRIHRLVSNGVAVHQAPVAVVPSRKSGKNGHGRGLTFIRKLGPYVGKELNSDEMAKVAGAKSSTGLGPKMAQIKKNLANDGVMLEDFVIRKKPDSGPVTWAIVKAEAA